MTEGFLKLPAPAPYIEVVLRLVAPIRNRSGHLR